MTAASYEALECTVGEKNETVYQNAPLGLRGLLMETFKTSADHPIQAWDLPENTADWNRPDGSQMDLIHHEIVTSYLGSDMCQRRGPAGARPLGCADDLSQPTWISKHAARQVSGYFVPPVTGSYEFFVAGGDTIDLAIGLGGASIDDATFSSVARLDCTATQGSDYNSQSHDAVFLPEANDCISTGWSSPGPSDMIAGTRYPFRLRHAWQGSSSRAFAKVALHLTNFTAEPSHRNKLRAAAPANELQKLRIGIPQDLSAEVHTILHPTTSDTIVVEISNPHLPTNPRTEISFAADAEEAEIARQIARTTVGNRNQYYVAQCWNRNIQEETILPCVAVTSTESSGFRTLTVTIAAPFDESRCLDTGEFQGHVHIDGISSDTTATRTQVGPAPICGTFRISYGGLFSEPISFRDAWRNPSSLDMNGNWDFLPKVMSIGEGQLQLEPFRPTSADGISPGWDPYRALELLLCFVAPSGAVEMLQVDTSELTGDFSVTTSEVVAGQDDSVWLSTIPVDLFELPEMSFDADSAPVVVKTNGVTGSIPPVSAKGVDLAREACMAFHTDQSVVPSQFVNSWAVGCMIPLTPSTLSECQSKCNGCPGHCGRCCSGGSCCARARTKCEEACVTVFEQLEQINTTWTKVAPPTYTYDNSYTPIVKVTSQEVVVGDTLSLYASNLYSRDSDGHVVPLVAASDSDVSIRLGNAACVDIADFGEATWTDSTSGLTITGRELRCTIGRGAAGIHSLSVVAPLGTAEVRPMATIALRATISSIAPLIGSLAGGTPLEITGTGLTGLACKSVIVGGQPCATPSNIMLPGTEARDNFLVCLTPPLASLDPLADRNTWPVTESQSIVISGVHGQFVYSSDATAHIMSVTPTVRSAATSTVVTIEGSALYDVPAVWIGSQHCAVSTATDTRLECRLPRTPPDQTFESASPQLWSAPDGYAAVHPDATITSMFEVRTISPRFISRAGGAILTITGVGFTAPPGSTTIALMMPFGERRYCDISDIVDNSGIQTITCTLDEPGPDEEGGVETWSDAVTGGVDHNRRRVLTGSQDTDEPPRFISSFAEAALAAGRLRLPGVSKVGFEMQDWLLTHTLNSVDSLISNSSTSINSSRRRRMSESWDLPARHPGGPGQDGNFSRSAGFLVVTVNHVEARCATNKTSNDCSPSTGSCGCNVAYVDEATPLITAVEPSSGSHVARTVVRVTVARAPPNPEHAFTSVKFGDTECPISSFEPHDSLPSTIIISTEVCVFPSGDVVVGLFSNPRGAALVADGVDATFTQELVVDSLTPALGPFFGGVGLTIEGAGFGEDTEVLIDGATCEVASVQPTELQVFPPLFRCPTGWSHFAESCYKLGQEGHVLFPAAKAACESEGGHLATISNSEENEFVRQVANHSMVWIGLLNEADYHTWLDGSSSIYEKWHTGSEHTVDRWHHWDCATLNSHHATWMAQNCCRESRELSDDLRSCAPDEDMCLQHSSQRHNRNEKCEHQRSDQINHNYVCEMPSAVAAFSAAASSEPRLSGESMSVTVRSGTRAAESPSQQLRYTFGSPSDAPNIVTVSSSGRNDGTRSLTLIGDRFGSDAGRVVLGSSAIPDENVECLTSRWSDTEVECTAPAMVAGLWAIRILDISGSFSNALSIEAELIINAVSLGGLEVSTVGPEAAILESGFGGGLPMTLYGLGLAETESQVSVSVCDEECVVTFTNQTTTVCMTPTVTTAHAIEVLSGAYPVENIAESADAFFSDWSSRSDVQHLTEDVQAEQDLASAVFTSRVDEAIRLEPGVRDMGTRRVCSFGFELASHQLGVISSIALFPPTKDEDRPRAKHILFQAQSLDSDNWITIANMNDALDTGVSMQQGWNEVEVDGVQARKFKIFLPRASGCNAGRELMRGARFRGHVINAKADRGLCSVTVDRVEHDLTIFRASPAPLRVNIHHTVEHTPIINAISPQYGTARGGTLVRLGGSNLYGGVTTGQDEIAAVSLNGYDCTGIQSHSESEISCVTSARSAEIRKQQTSAWVAGKGNALVIANASGSTRWQYTDRWSDHRSWLDSEMPVDGDTVIVPEGEAIMVDQDTPKLFLLLVMGSLVFEDAQDLSMNATYIWVAGGSFSVGTEAQPFTHKATITLHGDRWKTIELPFIGSKVLAVTNRGGLSTACHKHTISNREFNSEGPQGMCDVHSVGKLDLHGIPGKHA